MAKAKAQVERTCYYQKSHNELFDETVKELKTLTTRTQQLTKSISRISIRIEDLHNHLVDVGACYLIDGMDITDADIVMVKESNK